MQSIDEIVKPLEWCQPMQNGEPMPRMFIVKFEDSEMGYAIFDDETEAYDFWERANVNWNCFLFGAMPVRARATAKGGQTDG